MKIVIINFIPLMQQSSRDFFMLFSKSFLTSLFSGSVATLQIVSEQLLFGNLLSLGLLSVLFRAAKLIRRFAKKLKHLPCRF